jgi:hypothetical protein
MLLLKGGDRKRRGRTMGTHHKTAFALTQHRLSIRSMLLAGIFVITVLGAVFVDVDALLEYFELIVGSPANALEMGAIVTVAATVPFLAMGMSIADDEMHREA